MESSNTIQTDDKLKKGIVDLYDDATGKWEDIWGDHMHHGFYDADTGEHENESLPNHQSAQIRTIEEALNFAGLLNNGKKPERIVDVGCGIGGSSRYLANKFGGAKVCGITISPAEIQKAQNLSAAQNLADQVSFQVADALNLPFPDGHFDLVWSLESADHMPNKAKFVSELARVAAPGGTIIIVTWCHRDLAPEEKSLNPDEKELLFKISERCSAGKWCSVANYVDLLESHNLQEIKSADWSANVAFWPAVIRTALAPKGVQTSPLDSGWRSAMKKGEIKYVIITCKKPE